MSSLTEIRDLLKEMNEEARNRSEEDRDELEATQEKTLESGHVLGDIKEEQSRGNIDQETILQQISTDISDIASNSNAQSDGDTEVTVESEEQTSLLSAMVATFKGLGKNFTKFFDVFKRDKKKESRGTSVMGKDFDKGAEKGDAYKAIGEKIKNPFLMIRDQAKVMISGLMTAVGSLFGFLSSIFSPITALIIGVGSGIFKAFKAFTGTEGTMGDKLIAAVEGFVDGFFTGIGKAIGFILDLIPKALKVLGFKDQAATAEAMIGDLKKFVSGLYDSIKDALSGVTELFEKAVHWVEDNWDTIKAVMDSIWVGIKTVVGQVWDGIKMVFNGLKAVFTTISDWVVDNWDTIKAVMDSVWVGIKTVALAVFDGLKGIFNGLKAVFNVVSDWFTENWDTIKAAVDLVWNTVVTTATAVFNVYKGIFNAFKLVFDTVSDWFTENWDTIKAAVDLVWETVKTVVTNVFNFYKGIFTGIKTVFDGVLAFFSSEDSDENDEKVQAVKDLFTKMKDKVMGIFTSIKDVFKSFTDMLVIPDLSAYIPDIGNVLNSMGNFIAEAIAKAVAFIKSKIPFMGGDEEKVDLGIDRPELGWNERRKERNKAEKAGAIETNRKGDVLSFDEEKISAMSNEDLGRLSSAAAGSSKELDTFIAGEISRRESGGKVGRGTMATALNAAPSVPTASGVAPATVSSGNIVGLSHEGVAHSGQMQVAQKSLDQSKTTNYVNKSAGNTSLNNVDNSSSVVNNSYYSPGMPSPIDASDKASQPLIFRR